MNILTNQNIAYDYSGLFKTETEWIHRERTEITFEIICVTEGTVYLCDSGTEYALTKGQCILLYPGTTHYGYRPSSGVSFYWVHFHAEPSDFPIPPGVYDGMERLSLFKELLHLANLPSVPVYAVNAVLIHILSLFLADYEKEESGASRLAGEIHEWIRINASAKLSAEKIASHFGFSKDHITRLLQKSIGLGTKELTDKFIILRAKELLCSTTKYIKEIGADLGFSSDKAFISFFKYHEGISPSKFREKFTQTHMNNR